MADESYEPKVYMKQEGDEQVVASGGVVTVESGGAVNIEAGGQIQDDGTQASAIADFTDNSGGTADGTIEAVSGSGADAAINNNFAELVEDVDAIKAALRGAGIIASS